VTYNSSNNELVRTKTLVKSAIVQVDATPFRQWYVTHYGQELGKKALSEEEKKFSKTQLKKFEARRKNNTIDPQVADQFKSGRLYAAIASRPGQCGRCDGYILEGTELAFYIKKMAKKKSGKKE
jgi:small subunit ribosomal protein S8e